MSEEKANLYIHLRKKRSLSLKTLRARVEAAEVLRINPKFSVKKYEKRASYKNKADTELYIGVMRKAGLK
jgi:hypothetical protein